MNIDKMVEIEILYSQYSSLLTEKQREIISLYYEEDYSLGEISQFLDISRQSVHDSLKRSEKSLREYEEKLKIVEKSEKIDELLNKANRILDYQNKSTDAINDTEKDLKDILDKIRELL